MTQDYQSALFWFRLIGFQGDALAQGQIGPHV
jgi:hypothetical protein